MEKYVKLFEDFVNDSISYPSSYRPDTKEHIVITKKNINKYKNTDVITAHVAVQGISNLEELGIERIIGTFSCFDNNLTSLKGSPKITGGYSCNTNNISSFDGHIKRVNGEFDCSNNRLTSLENGPVVTGGYYCFSNNLTSLKGCPTKINGYFNCSYNELTSLEGAPKIVKGNFYIDNNAKQFTEEEVREVIDVKGEVYV